ncbi:MAG: hypothetical protein AAF514_17235, partial [Verrucomicrobiota bacterium]
LRRDLSAMKAILVIGFLGLSVFSSQAETHIKRGAEGWRYFDTGNAPAAGWTSLEFDAQTWQRGTAPLGYETEDGGRDGLATEISFGDDPEAKHTASYFRLRFQVEDPVVDPHLGLRACVDDGAVFYLNGKEVGRLRMPDGEAGVATLAAGKVGGSSEEYVFLKLEPGALRAGENVLAVSVHQASAGSSDLFLDVDLAGLSDEDFRAFQFPARFREIQSAHEKMMADYQVAYRRARTNEERLAAQKEFQPQIGARAIRALIASDPSHEDVPAALLWGMQMVRVPLTAELQRILTKHHLGSEHLVGILFGLSYQNPGEKSRAWLEKLRSDHPDDRIGGMAAFVLSGAASDPEKTRLLKEASGRVGDLVYAEMPIQPMIEGEIFEREHLAIGKVAPEIEGDDIEGIPFKLSDYRGKVVVIDFWGDW